VAVAHQSLALVGITDLDDITTIYGGAVRDALLDAANHGVARVISPSDLVVDMGDGRFMALVSGPAERAREAGDRIAIAIEAVHVRGGGGVRVSAGVVAAGVAQWIDGDQGMEGMLTRAESALIPVPRTPVGITDTAVTGEFRSVAVADAA
jgi:GGDEF domain-containing protein